MVKKVLLFGALAALLASCSPKGGSDEATVVTVNDFETAAVNLVDKNVSIEGTVVHVCQHGGKRMFISDESGEKRIKIEISEGQTAFNTDLEGALVRVIGKVIEFKIDEPYLAEWEAELNAEMEATGDTTLKHEEQPEFDAEHIHNDSKLQDLKRIEDYRAEIAASGKDFIAFYSLGYVSHEVLEAAEPKTDETEAAVESDGHNQEHATTATEKSAEVETEKAAGEVKEMSKSEIDAAKGELNKTVNTIEKEVNKTGSKIENATDKKIEGTIDSKIDKTKDAAATTTDGKTVKNIKK